jgi:Outer membrane protein beta-barrel domain
MRRSFLFSALACGIFALAVPASAQDRTGTWEISPFAGGYFGGRLYGINSTVLSTPGPGVTPTTFRFVEPDDDLAYGARLAYNVTRHFAFEVDWTSARTDLRTPDVSGTFPRHERIGRLHQNVYEANALANFGRRRVVGYVGIGGGAAVLDLSVNGTDASSVSRFTANLSAGGKFFFTPRVGLRIDGRIRAIDLRSDGDNLSCDHDDRFCRDRRNWSYNGEVTGGLVFAF